MHHCCPVATCLSVFFFFNDTATTEIYTLSLHDALPISPDGLGLPGRYRHHIEAFPAPDLHSRTKGLPGRAQRQRDRKSTRLNSSHTVISYAVFCLKKKNQKHSTGLSVGHAAEWTRHRRR